MSAAPRKSLFSSLASTADHERLPDALVEWVKKQPRNDKDDAGVQGLDGLKDGLRLTEVVAQIDPDYFASLVDSAAAPNAKALADNWILRFNHLKKLYRLVVRYFEDVLRSSTADLLTPNLRLVAKNDPRESDDEVCKLIGLVLALAVQSPKKQEHIARIQKLDEWVQRELMYSIEQVMSKVRPIEIPEEVEAEEHEANVETDDADDFYTIRHEKSRIMHDKDALQILYDELAEQFKSLKEEHEETLGSLAASEAKTVELSEQVEKSKRERPDVALKVEIERLRAELQKTSTDLGEAEQVVDSQSKLIDDLTRRVDVLEPRAEEAVRLKDQVDELRHASDKAKKQENVIEKYKKKLEEAAETKRMLKTLEEQNADLLDKNASLEDEYAKAAAFKPLLDSYKSKVDSLETKSSALQRDMEGLKLELDRAREAARKAEEERQRCAENLLAYEERVREFEATGPASAKMRRSDTGTSVDEAELGGGLGSELDDAMAGATMTDLKLRIRRLERELKRFGSNEEAPSPAVMQDLLDEASRLKDKYQQEYLAEHREKLVLGARLDEIASGKSNLGDGPEAAIAIRHRLEQTSAELDALRKGHHTLEARCTKLDRQLKAAQVDLSLVNADEVEALQTLRESVSSEKTALEAQVDELQKALHEAEDKARLQMEEVNKLLSGKVREQDGEISLRDEALKREEELRSARETHEARAVEHSSRVEALERERDDLAAKVQKMKEFIKQQDKLFRAEQAAAAGKQTTTDDAADLAMLQGENEKQAAEVKRLKAKLAEVEATYRKEQQTMLAAWHDLGLKTMRERVLATATTSAADQKPYQPQSWLSQQRARAAAGKGLRHT